MGLKSLVVFDFDHTIIDGNSDVYIQKLAPKGLPSEIQALYSDQGWTDFMGAIFKHLHDHSVSIEDIKSKVLELHLTSGMRKLFDLLSKNRDQYEVIVISDANTLFIDWILEEHKIIADKVYTNPAVVDEQGLLNIDYYHQQDWCKISSKNMCKGYIMEAHMKEKTNQGEKYARVHYVGDGSNDLCPSLRLSKEDYVFPRKNFPLHKRITEKTTPVKAKVVPWACASEIVKTLENLV